MTVRDMSDTQDTWSRWVETSADNLAHWVVPSAGLGVRAFGSDLLPGRNHHESSA
jgi:hypothetical protein